MTQEGAWVQTDVIFAMQCAYHMSIDHEICNLLHDESLSKISTPVLQGQGKLTTAADKMMFTSVRISWCDSRVHILKFSIVTSPLALPNFHGSFLSTLVSKL